MILVVDLHRHVGPPGTAADPAVELIEQLLFGGRCVQRIETGLAHEAVGNDVDPALEQSIHAAFDDLLDTGLGDLAVHLQRCHHRALHHHVDTERLARRLLGGYGRYGGIDEAAHADAHFLEHAEQHPELIRGEDAGYRQQHLAAFGLDHGLEHLQVQVDQIGMVARPLAGRGERIAVQPGEILQIGLPGMDARQAQRIGAEADLLAEYYRDAGGAVQHLVLPVEGQIGIVDLQNAGHASRTCMWRNSR